MAGLGHALPRLTAAAGRGTRRGRRCGRGRWDTASAGSDLAGRGEKDAFGTAGHATAPADTGLKSIFLTSWGTPERAKDLEEPANRVPGDVKAFGGVAVGVALGPKRQPLRLDRGFIWELHSPVLLAGGDLFRRRQAGRQAPSFGMALSYCETGAIRSPPLRRHLAAQPLMGIPLSRGSAPDWQPGTSRAPAPPPGLLLPRHLSTFVSTPSVALLGTLKLPPCARVPGSQGIRGETDLTPRGTAMTLHEGEV
jgi:hypothetical protein